MKKSTLKSLVSYLNGETITNLDEIKGELEAELARGEEKAAANRAMYAEAHDVVINAMGYVDHAMTLAEIVEACGDELPEGFTKSKLQYALLNYWTTEVVVNRYGQGVANTYRLA